LWNYLCRVIGVPERNPIMWLVGVLYVTRNGQTAKIANHVAHRLTGLGVEAQLRNLDSSPDTPGLSTYDAVILAAPVHRGRHGRAMTGFVKRHLDALRNIPAAFISVSLSQAGVERAGTTPKAHAAFVADVQGVLDRFSQETGWYPEQVKPVAGALKIAAPKPVGAL
jgi:menaquinone-dependent protoporphyrinogen oxidase